MNQPVDSKHTLTALIVDDEEKARTLLKHLLGDTNHFHQIVLASSAHEALDELKRYTPDLIFLDIKMPGENGVSLLKQLNQRKITSKVIFVTAYDEFALQALRLHAFGYLLKPVNRTELDECIAHFIANNSRSSPHALDKLLELLDNQSRLKISTRTGYHLLDPDQILYCEADGNYTRIELWDKAHLCSMQLGAIEKLLPVNTFSRLGRSLIVNRSHIASVDRKLAQVVFEAGSKTRVLKVSRSQLRGLEQGLAHEARP